MRRPWVEQAVTDYRHQSWPWMEIFLPFCGIAAVILYYRPETLPPGLKEQLVAGMFKWVLWGIVGALGGALGLSAFLLGFFLLYSVVYLIGNATRILDPQVWMDQREVRFYFSSFVMLCVLVALAFFSPQAALAAYVLLAGCALLLWRLLV